MTKIRNGNCLEVMKRMPDNSVDSIVTDPPYGISFMGKHWDYNVPKVEVWQEALRVLKPGGHALIACGTRTQHRMAMNIEDAGFEIRDIVGWIYGSGFPKSLNIGKAVDKLHGKEVKTSYILNYKNDKYGSGMGGGITDNTPSDNEWEGYGTALKPAMELWTLCRKPLSEPTVAANVLKWGTGGINVDASRVGVEERTYKGSGAQPSKLNNHAKGDTGVGLMDGSGKDLEFKVSGRFPANLIHDGSDEAVKGFPNGKVGARKAGQVRHINKGDIPFAAGITTTNYPASEGSAARFFYCAKASKAERNAGLEGFEEKQPDESRKEGNPGGDNPRNRGVNKTQNHHPTVKPIALMRYLCRLITPPQGTILDCFAGSGSTGIAAKLEGFGFIGIEREAEYCRIAEARMANAAKDETATQGKLL